MGEKVKRRSVKPFEERFWPKVDRSGDCWLWCAAKDGGGYGKFAVGTRRFDRAHRVSFAMANGPLPDGACVLHRCDVRACVNPAHLFLGTQQENIKDMVAKGRQRGAAGDRNPNAKLSNEAVADIRARRSRGESLVSIARDFGVHPRTAGLAASGRQTWRTSHG